MSRKNLFALAALGVLGLSALVVGRAFALADPYSDSVLTITSPTSSIRPPVRDPLRPPTRSPFVP